MLQSIENKIVYPLNIIFYFFQPCDVKLFEYFSENLVIIAGVAIGIGFVMVSSSVKIYRAKVSNC